VTLLTCSLCGTTLDADADDASGLAALTWVVNHEHGTETRYCASCARQNLRAIEGGLDAAYF
jgi:hypothetical protein